MRNRSSVPGISVQRLLDGGALLAKLRQLPPSIGNVVLVAAADR